VSDWGDVAVQTLKCGLTMAAGTVLAWTAARYLPDIPIVNRLVLAPPADPSGEEGESPAETLLGHLGTTLSVVGFAGTARIGQRRISVLTDGEFIPAGTPVRVVEVEGKRVVVRRT
jgi:membrane-bound serine protease (ClpP class)